MGIWSTGPSPAALEGRDGEEPGLCNRSQGDVCSGSRWSGSKQQCGKSSWDALQGFCVTNPLIEELGSLNQGCYSSENFCPLASIQKMCSAKSFSKSIAQTWPLWTTQTWVSRCIELPQGIPAHCCFSPEGHTRAGSPCHAVTYLASPCGGESPCTDAAATEQSFWGSPWAS